MRTSPSRLLTLAGLALVAGVFWLGVEWWIARQPLGEDFSAEVARLTGDVPETPASLAVPDGPVRLAVGPLGLPDTAAEGAVADLLVAELSGDEGFQLVERRDFARLMQEFELGAAGAIKPADAVRLGRLLRADWFVLGGAYRAGTNSSAVVRIVDAASGIVRDLLVLPGGQEPARAAASLAALLRRQRMGTEAGGELPEFVAVGGFEDLSVRPRHAGVEAELRSHLTATLTAGPMIVLERELTRLLLEEIRLQQAGLIESTNPPPRLQSTFWLVDGFWQSFDSVGDEIDLTLRVSRIGGAVLRRNLRANRGPTLEAAVAATMQELIRDAPEPARPATRKGEIRAQLALGMERSGLTDQDLEARHWLSTFPRLRWNDSQNTTARRRENYLAAMQAFESMLLLDSGHAFAKLYLARCLVDPAINRPEEARNLYRELLGNQNGLVARTAQESLGYAYLLHGEARRAVEWFRQLRDRAPDDRKLYFQRMLDEALDKLPPSSSSLTDADLQAKEQRLINDLRAWLVAAQSGRVMAQDPGFGWFLGGRPAGYVEGRKHLVKVFPRLVEAAPELKPHLLVRASLSLVATNNPLLGELQEAIGLATQSPGALIRPEFFFRELRHCLDWLDEPALAPTCAMVADALLAAQAAGIKVELDSGRQARLGYAYVGVQRWEDALVRFRSIPDQVVAMGGGGPWGEYPAYVVPFNRVRACLRQLGRPVPVDPTMLDIPPAVTIPNRQFVFLPDGARLWIACCDQVVEQSVAGGPGLTNTLGNSLRRPPQVMVQSADTLWIGTAGDGLFQMDKTTKQIRRYTVDDGLLFNGISALHLEDTELCIGYEQEKSGGVSRMNIRTGEVRTFSPALAKREPSDLTWVLPDDWTGAPRRPVKALALDEKGDLWAAVFGLGLQRFQTASAAWETMVRREEFPSVECLAVSEKWVVLGEAPRPIQEEQTHLLTILRRNSSEPSVHLGPADGLPYFSVHSVALDGDRLWVAGPSYLAILDLNTRKILRRCLVNSAPVSQLTIQGDDVWVRMNRAIYRYPRSLAHEAGL